MSSRRKASMPPIFAVPLTSSPAITTGRSDAGTSCAEQGRPTRSILGRASARRIDARTSAIDAVRRTPSRSSTKGTNPPVFASNVGRGAREKVEKYIAV